MSYQSIVGHHQNIKLLKAMKKNNQISHSYIFYGVDGVGKSITAKAFTKSIFCKDSIQTSCGECKNCDAIENNRHSDILEIYPEGLSIKNDKIPLIQEFAYTKPDSDRKVIIIYEADKLTKSAQNSLLKVIEEPPSYVVFIFVTENIRAVELTIQSRCYKMLFNKLSDADIKEYIKQEKISIHTIESYLPFVNGSIKRLLELVNDESLLEQRKKIIDLVEVLVEKNDAQLVEYIEFFLENKDDFDILLNLLVQWYRDLLVLNETNDDTMVINKDQIDKLKKHRMLFSSEIIIKIINEIDDIRKISKSHVNFELVIQNLLLNIRYY